MSEMFTIPFWVALGCALLASLGVCVYYGRHAIHPRLRPHFGQVVMLFLLMALGSFFVAVVVARIVDRPPPKPKSPVEQALPAPPPEPAAAPAPEAAPGAAAPAQGADPAGGAPPSAAPKPDHP